MTRRAADGEGAEHVGSDLLTSFKLLGSVVAPTALVTALLYYFGWVRTGAVFAPFGVEQSMLGFSTNDYLLRSAGVAFRPLAVLIVGVGGVLLVHRVLTDVSARWNRVGRRVAVGVAVASGALLVVALTTIVGGRLLAPLASAVVLVFGSLLLEAAASVAWPRASRGTQVQRRAVLLGILLLGSFWACAVYAQDSGARLAAAIANDPGTRSTVTVLSAEQQHLEGAGVSVQPLAGGRYRFRYEGLRLLIYTDRTYFLLPRTWSTGQHRLVVLREDPAVRVELGPAG